MTPTHHLYFFTWLLLVNYAHSAKILYFFSTGCRSTASVHRAISKALLERRHEIVAISAYPFEKLTNYTDIGIQDEFFQFSDEFSMDDEITGTYTIRTMAYDIQNANCENIYRNAKVHGLLANLKVDLIFFEIESTECFLPLLTRLNAPIIAVSTGNLVFPEFDGLMGNPVNPSYVPNYLSGFSSKMNFYQRLHNVRDYLLDWAIVTFYTRQADHHLAQYLRSPPIAELYDRISLMFYNSHYTLVPKPTAPNSLSIAGIHIEDKPSPLPEDIRKFIEESKNGVIYLSLGSVVSFSKVSKRIRDPITNVMSRLPYRVIWRHDKPEMLEGVSKNILARKWLPQREILAHSKTVMFITHSGILSTYESIYYGKPMLITPILYDQFTNAVIMESLGLGLTMDLRNFDEKSLKSSIEEIAKNNKYRENASKLSAIFKDRPMSAKDTLIYWTEYVLRHKDVSFLKPAGAKLPFYQYLLLDVIFFVVSTLILSCWLVYATFKKLLSLICKRKRIEKSTKKPKMS